ncbi:uncharacterized protein N7483_010487 [Penicillium malachiteum]|uniref:uncharacterized protein n=1 Tax=Penicillium malachiteum TaxID=1324776 RepID=UPI002547DDB7|nr:uncharacterized protein N7483_010487 [Penicillium malachiteum]KAJ5713306.1 hypothetical protein N7483_010487 [Penicillium malachiteum]
MNHVPNERLDVYVVGTNCYGELGLGDLTKKAEMKRPVLNSKLDAETTGIVHLAVGGVHSAALTHENQILTWGVNDEGALGRDTKEKEVPSDEGNESGDEITLNLSEATPTPVDASHFPENTIFCQLAASDSATFTLTTDGMVYGWGTFRGSNGGIGFSPKSKKEQHTPILIPVQDVVNIVAGAQHVLALTSSGTVFSWGCNEQNQLGRRRASRHRKSHDLLPEIVALPSGIRSIGVGLYHSFAIHKSGTVYAWGSNNFGQTAVTIGTGLNDSNVAYPTKVPILKTLGVIVSIFGGKDHSMALTETGKCLVWGRIENKALGVELKDIPSSDIIEDKQSRPRILKKPHFLTGIGDDNSPIDFATAGSDHSFVFTESGEAYSWGFNSQSQAGQLGIEEIERPMLVQSKHLEGKRLVAAAAGGQFSILLGVHEGLPRNRGRRRQRRLAQVHLDMP